MKMALSAVSVALAVTACGPKAENAQAPASPTAENSSITSAAPTPEVAAPGQAFADSVASGDAFELAMSNLAIEKSQSSAVKKFAQAMVKAHTESTAKLKTAAAGLTPAIVPGAALTTLQQQKLDALGSKSGAAFDQAFKVEQIAAHQSTLAALRSYAATPDVPAFGAFATEMVPIVTAHLNMANSLKP